MALALSLSSLHYWTLWSLINLFTCERIPLSVIQLFHQKDTLKKGSLKPFFCCSIGIVPLIRHCFLHFFCLDCKRTLYVCWSGGFILQSDSQEQLFYSVCNKFGNGHSSSHSSLLTVWASIAGVLPPFWCSLPVTQQPFLTCYFNNTFLIPVKKILNIVPQISFVSLKSQLKCIALLPWCRCLSFDRYYYPISWLRMQFSWEKYKENEIIKVLWAYPQYI